MENEELCSAGTLMFRKSNGTLVMGISVMAESEFTREDFKEPERLFCYSCVEPEVHEKLGYCAREFLIEVSRIYFDEPLNIRTKTPPPSTGNCSLESKVHCRILEVFEGPKSPRRVQTYWYRTPRW